MLRMDGAPPELDRSIFRRRRRFFLSIPRDQTAILTLDPVWTNLGVRRRRKIKQKTMIIFKSKGSMRIVAMAVAAMWAIAAAHAEAPIGPVFTYQGEMLQNGEPVNVKSDFQFSLWDELDGCQF